MHNGLVKSTVFPKEVFRPSMFFFNKGKAMNTLGEKNKHFWEKDLTSLNRMFYSTSVSLKKTSVVYIALKQIKLQNLITSYKIFN